MEVRRRLAALAGGALVAIALGAAGCGQDPDRHVYSVVGTVQQVDPEGRWVKVAHEEIEDFMPAMSMNFDVERPELLEGVVPGNRIDFALERSGAKLTIVGLRKTADGDPLEAAPSPADVEQAAPFSLVDQDGEPLALADLRGKAVLIDFIFTRCPGPCPMITAAHVNVQRAIPDALAERVHFVSITLDPEYDTPERLREYAEARGVEFESWSFLTGEPEVVDAVLAAYHIGKRPAASPEGIIDHFIASFLVDPEGRIAETFIGDGAPPDAIVRAIERALG